MCKQQFVVFLLCLLALCSCTAGRQPIQLQLPEAENAEVICYGQSGSGCYDLTAYRFGAGENVLLLTFAIHGWEDNFPQDGQALVLLGNQVITYLDGHTELLQSGSWSVYVIPCANPDGLCLGSTCSGAGRCTVYADADKGVDINRSFPYAFEPYYDNRNNNAGTPLACEEARALAEFTQTVQGSGRNLCVDTHGWYAQVLTTSSDSTAFAPFERAFPQSTVGSLAEGRGYFSAWCGYVLGFEACLLELPSDIHSLWDFERSEISAAYLSALEAILTDSLKEPISIKLPSGSAM